MQLGLWIKRGLCIVCAAVAVFSFTACGKKDKKTVSEVFSHAASDVGHLTNGGYELPYEYSDGYKGVMKVVDDSEFETVSATPGGNLVIHFTTTKSVAEVEKYYEDYFATLPMVKAKKETDNSVGYFDAEKRMILFNLVVWTADGQTNYKLGAEACDKLEDSKLWQAK